jgi:hypothetical protein
MDELRGRHPVGPARILGLSLVLVGAGLFTSCSSGGQDAAGPGSMPGMEPGQMNDHGYMGHPAGAVGDWVLPEFATAVPMVAEAYSFAVEHPEVLSYLPCSCGCEGMGHNSNWNCYVKSVMASGEVIFDNHGSGCNVCIDITLDAKSMWQRGSPLTEIREYIDANYPATMQTEWPVAA